MPEITRRRAGEIHRAIFQVLLDQPEGLPVQELSRRAELLCPATAFENEDYPNQPGVRRYPKMQRFTTISSVKAGWLVKMKGTWHLTEAGREAFARYEDPDEFHREAVQGYQRWKAERPPAEFDATEDAEDIEAARLEVAEGDVRRAWLCRGANLAGVSVLPRWFKDGFCSIQWLELPDISAGTPKAEIAKLVKEHYPDSSPVSQGLSVGILDRFVNAMQIGDLVVTVDGPRVYVGEIRGDPTFTGEKLVTRQRAVAWTNPEAPVLRAQLSSDAADGLRGQLTISDLTSHVAEFATLAGLERWRDHRDSSGRRRPRTRRGARGQTAHSPAVA